MEAIGASLAKLSKGLAGADDETVGATKALQFLGVRAKDPSGNLRDPAEVMNDVALKLAEFEDGAGKTAIAMELFGKSGATMLPFLKDLAENQDLNIRLTAKQIEEADQVSNAMGRMRAESNFVAQTLVTAAIPSLSVLYQELKNVILGTDNAVDGGQRLRSEGTLTNWAEKTAYAIAVVIDALRGIGNTIKSVIKRNAIVAQANQNYVDLWDMPLPADAVTRRFEDIRKATETRLAAQEDFTERLRALTDEEEAILRRGLESVAKTTHDKLKLQDRLTEILLKRQRLEREAQQSNLERQIRLPGETMKDLAEQAARGQSELRAIEEQIKTLRETGAISELDSLRRLAAARRYSANQLATLAGQARELVEDAPGNEKLADALKKIEESARQAADGASLLGVRVSELADPEAGFAKGLRLVAEEVEQIGRQMELVTVQAFNGMTDALVNFVMTGKLDFRSLANSIISDLIRIQIQRAITLPMARAMSSIFGFADGGVMTSAGPMALRSYASGGIANSPQLALFGEGSRPEAYVPLPDGRSIPVTMSGGAFGGDVFNISVSISDGGASSRGDDPAGRDLGRAIASAVRHELLAQKRAGGLLDGRRAV